MNAFWTFLAHGGFKLLIIALALIGHSMKKSTEKAAKEQPQRPMPNSMPPQEAMPSQTLTPPKPVAAPKQKTLQSGSDSPWSSSSNPFDGKKK